MTVEVSFDGKPESVARARRFTEGALGGVSASTVIDVVLMVSELATNAVVHAATTFSLRIDKSEEIIRVEVVDGGSGRVRLQSPSNRDVHGRGLQLVASLSDQWGTREDGQTKAVWFVRNLGAASIGRHRQGTVAHQEPSGALTRSRAKQAVERRTPELLAARTTV
jgi:anti-sigma regulatory factor (Ser/Thr protein kinase)